jgi:DNA-binding NarL/FixJ family response regulator
MQPQILTPVPPAPPAGVVLADARTRLREHLAQTIRDQRDMRVLAAYETTQETWRFLRSSRPEILLLDWRLPDAGAMTLLRRLPPASDLKVILLSEEKDPDVLVQALILGARGVLSRSARPESVLRCARSVLAGELWFPRGVTRALRDQILARTHPQERVAGLVQVLTPREADVVRGVTHGLANREIAAELGISVQTVRHHLKAIFGKVHVSSRLELALLVAQNRL